MATTTEGPAIDPLDYLATDALLDDEERVGREIVEGVDGRALGGRRHALDILRNASRNLDRSPAAGVNFALD